MVFFKIGIIEIDFTSLIALIIGIGIGIALTLLVYAVLLVVSLKPKKYVVKAEAMVTDEEIKEILDNSYNSFNDRELQGEKPTFIHCKDVCLNLIKDISRKFFPDSKHPSLEFMR